jgi:hypothetical protein
MSQFIIFTLDPSIKKEETYQNILELNENKEIFFEVKNVYLKNVDYQNLYTILNFDEICTASQLFFLNETFIESQLYKVLEKLNNEKIILWYGNDYKDLPETITFKELIKNIKNDLQITSGELYFCYNRSA